MSELIAHDSVNQSIYFRLTDINTGGPLVGGGASLVEACTYTRERDEAIAITVSDIAQNAAWTSGGLAEVENPSAPGLYRLDVPAAAFAAGAAKVEITLHLTDGISETKEIQLVTPSFLAGGGGGGAGPNTDGAPITQGTVGATVVTVPAFKTITMLDTTVRKDYF
ncbi:MAG: hypothetical protein ACRCZI_11970 [Cetobacterium sp.]